VLQLVVLLEEHLEASGRKEQAEVEEAAAQRVKLQSVLQVLQLLRQSLVVLVVLLGQEEEQAVEVGQGVEVLQVVVRVQEVVVVWVDQGTEHSTPSSSCQPQSDQDMVYSIQRSRMGRRKRGS